MNKKNKFSVPGIYHSLEVRFVRQKWLASYAKDKYIMGYYDEARGCIYVAKELNTQVRIHTFWHEMSHHVDEIMKTIKDEETRCDLQGSFLMRLNKKAASISKKLKK